MTSSMQSYFTTCDEKEKTREVERRLHDSGGRSCERLTVPRNHSPTPQLRHGYLSKLKSDFRGRRFNIDRKVLNSH